MPMTQDLQRLIDLAWDNRASLDPTNSPEIRAGVEEVIAGLDAGTIRVAGLEFTPAMQATDTMYEISAPGFGGAVLHIRQDGKSWLTR